MADQSLKYSSIRPDANTIRRQGTFPRVAEALDRIDEQMGRSVAYINNLALTIDTDVTAEDGIEYPDRT